jgi:hypothetical protein
MRRTTFGGNEDGQRLPQKGRSDARFFFENGYVNLKRGHRFIKVFYIGLQHIQAMVNRSKAKPVLVADSSELNRLSIEANPR